MEKDEYGVEYLVDSAVIDGEEEVTCERSAVSMSSQL